ncbi:pentatricopeptide repeat-containing protein At1g59720, chloroplastic/mitochondrial-like [Salvia miltiorrhiza]|uniref:pentatricopeptide repeat-containing protein At1g59720, chloroplastic/mitochondrial-like n=1 Tax=Salvia miltiorrhiza TaxID=226208 RepID=UPI0025ACAE18|nr:pentatricopeptide repeat-containing protein At1g59720, chloroplastic/mitochondrial-like [Salvia miltiorrhiza]
MAMLLATTLPAEPSTVQLHRHDQRVLHILTQSVTVPLPHLKQIHAKILRTAPQLHHTPQSVYLYSRLLYFSALQDLIYTLRLFHNIPNPNTFIYNTLIRAYAHSKLHKNRAFCVFQELLLQEALLPDKHTFPFVLKACAHSFNLIEGKQTHAQVVKRGCASDVYVSNSLIHFYASCGLPENATKVFDKMPERSLVSWNAIIDALVLAGEFYKALRMFVEMMPSFEPDGYTVQSVINACTGLGALSMGMWLHAYLLKKCEIDPKFDILVNNSLIEMYYKCGSMRMALQVLQSMRRRDVNSWNAAILGLAVHGEAERVFEHFDRMISEDKLRPNSITFVGVLSACNHRGLVNEGRRYFDLMSSKYKVEPVLQHYGCLVDLLARSGRIDEAVDIVSSMPVKPDDVIWRSLLDASCKQGEGIDMSQEMAKRLMEGERGSSSGAYVLLSRVFASANRWDEVGLIRKLMMDENDGKEPGCSSVEVDGVVHKFFAGDTTHPRSREIYQFLRWMEERVKMAGYVHDLSQAPLVDEARDRKGDSLGLHSERLAIAFALLHLKSRAAPIRVFKNLRVCNDCHNFIKLISKVMNVEIVMRDRLRFHCFRNGSCSCLDFW